MAIITVSRQVAAHGDEVAAELAKILNYKFVTRKDIEKRIVELGFPEEKMLKYDSSPLLQRTGMNILTMPSMPFWRRHSRKM